MKKQSGFTLIELLVVIAIIALLLAIVMPALSAVKEQAKKTICKTRMKGLGTAALVYTTEHNGYLPQPSGGNLLNNFDKAKYAADYYSYHGNSPTGPSGIGYLYNEGLIESTDSDQAYCPTISNFFGSRMPAGGWDSGGNPAHPNWIGKSSLAVSGSLTFEPQHEKNMNVDWLNQRTTIGTRMLGGIFNGKRYGYFKVEDATMKGQRAFFADVWASMGTGGTFWRSAYDDIPHKSGKRRALNTWYLDGSAESVIIEEDHFRDDGGTMYLNEQTTWSNLLD